jgi:hypothetical protein
MPLEDLQTIDIALKTASGNVELVVTDSGITIEPIQRLELLRQKLRTYATYVNSEEFNRDHPGITRDSVVIRVTCANPPSEEMTKLRAISIKSENPIVVPIFYDVFRPPNLSGNRR